MTEEENCKDNQQGLNYFYLIICSSGQGILGRGDRVEIMENALAPHSGSSYAMVYCKCFVSFQRPIMYCLFIYSSWVFCKILPLYIVFSNGTVIEQPIHSFGCFHFKEDVQAMGLYNVIIKSVPCSNGATHWYSLCVCWLPEMQDVFLFVLKY